MRGLGWTAVAAAATAALLLAAGWFWAFGASFGGVVSVESRSMSHGETEQSGVIDPGEWMQIEPVDDRSGIATLYEARETGHRFGGDHGDVLVYTPNGTDGGGSGAPGFPGLGGEAEHRIVHRAIAWVEYNGTSDAYDVPELGLVGVRSFTVPGVGTYDRDADRYVHRSFDVRLDPDSAGRHDGYLTKGDYNTHLDQHAAGGLSRTGKVEIVALDRVEGKVVSHVDEGTIQAVQLGVPLAALAVAGGVYAWRRGHVDGLVPSLEGDSCPDCGQAYQADEGFCRACGAER